MSLMIDLHQKLQEAMLDHETLARDMLRVILGEMSLNQARTGQPAADEVVKQYIKKMITNNAESMDALVKAKRADSGGYARLKDETKYLCSLVPALIFKDQVASYLKTVEADIKNAKADGQAIGVANKYLKGLGLEYFGHDAAAVVAEMRKP